MLFPEWSYATKKSNNMNQNTTAEKPIRKTHIRESLSNILLTHIDFRHPTLFHKILNSTKEDETIEKIPEPCIEEFNLYLSTWKGWQGALPSKDNRITWEQVEKENTIYGTVNCTLSSKDSSDSSEEPDEEITNTTNSSSAIPPILTSESYRYE